jgi:hypothetical protein
MSSCQGIWEQVVVEISKQMGGRETVPPRNWVDSDDEVERDEGEETVEQKQIRDLEHLPQLLRTDLERQFGLSPQQFRQLPRDLEGKYSGGRSTHTMRQNLALSMGQGWLCCSSPLFD